MGKHSHKRKHLEVFSSSSSSTSPPRSHSPSWLDQRREEEAHIKRLIKDTLLEMRAEDKRNILPTAVSPSSSEEEGLGPEDLTGKYISKDKLPILVHNVKSNKGFQEDEAPESSSLALLHQFHSSTPVDVPVHSCICDDHYREWHDPDKILMPCFMAKICPLQFYSNDSILVDAFVTSLVGSTSLADEMILHDPTDKTKDGSLKKVYSGSHAPLWDGIYGTHVAQSLILNLKTLYRALDESSDISGVLDMIEHQVEFLSDISFDVVRAIVLSKGVLVWLLVTIWF
ncbi:hypothetical protein NDU88_003455 [Pleurodeles waltl]|uniref:Uncharacterized protein n=1 Tax=Pleurodeles waltl TaxID=8319 RepID=A0AAV7KV04_PLEWA|nr:hypothetical protein NDU88_003455 [Pleurodeles waltl]